jgi:hypothetical protein
VGSVAEEAEQPVPAPVCPVCGRQGYFEMIEAPGSGPFVQKVPGFARCLNEDDERHVAYWTPEAGEQRG